MKELSLHILDIVQNSIVANATAIDIRVFESTIENILTIKIIDNGCGMSREFLENVISPFVTTRKTRKIGLGISLFKAAAERCNGCFFIDSVEGKGTSIEARFERSHIDRAPLGNMADTFTTLLLSNDNIHYTYYHAFDNKEFLIDTRKLKEVLGEEVPLHDFDVLEWIKGYILEGMTELFNVR